MPELIYALPDVGSPHPETAPVPDGSAWAHTLTAAPAWAIYGLAVGALATWLITRHLNATDSTASDRGTRFMYLPLLLVNLAAVYGQVAYAYEHIAPDPWPAAARLALGLMFAAAIESIAVYVGWHAHDALLQKATATAARLRRASYLLAGIVGLINYAHFAGPGLTPTAAAVAFGILSLLSPWLWGLHTRRAQHVRLTREGAVDTTGATFSGERMRAFPIRSYMARRWSIDNYVTDPRLAWEGYNSELRLRRSVRPAARARAAWMVLLGRADVDPGVLPAPRGGTDPGPEITARPGVVPAIGPGATPDTDPGTSAGDPPGDQVASNPGVDPGTEGAHTRAENPRQTRTTTRVQTRVPTPSNKQVKAQKLRAEHPGMAVAEIARRVGANEKTVRGWFKAAQDADDDTKERASVPLTLAPFRPTPEPAAAAVNGHHTPEEN
jgi:hypothetical protein